MTGDLASPVATRFVVRDVFRLRGRGTVLIGTSTGTIRTGDQLVSPLDPAAVTVVAGIELHVPPPDLGVLVQPDLGDGLTPGAAFDVARPTPADADAGPSDFVRRTIAVLSDPRQDAWPEVLESIAASRRRVEVLPAARAAGEATLLALGLTTRATLAAVAFHSAGLLVDGGWLRILGAGGEQIGGGLREWNGLGPEPAPIPAIDDALVVAYDALGGFFLLSWGARPGEPTRMSYLAPDTYEREPLERSYPDFVEFVLRGDLEGFYGDQRWPGWETEVAALGPDRVLSFYPPLGFNRLPVAERSRRPIPAREAWGLWFEIGRQLREIASGRS